jgi:hypothetical protein
LGKQRKKLTLKYLSPKMKQPEVEKLARYLTGDHNAEAFRYTTAPPGEWKVLYSPEREIPHYLSLGVEGDTERYVAHVYIPGRRMACLHCGEDSHWSNRCPTVNKNTNKRPTARSQEQTAPALESAITEDTNSDYTLVVSKKQRAQRQKRKLAQETTATTSATTDEPEPNLCEPAVIMSYARAVTNGNKRGRHFSEPGLKSPTTFEATTKRNRTDSAGESYTQTQPNKDTEPSQEFQPD